MGQAAKRFRGVFENTFLLKLITVVSFFFLIFPPLKPVMYGVVKIVLVWGAAQFLYDAVAGRALFKGRYIFWLALFLVMEAVTTVLNLHSGLKNNAALLCYTAVAVFLLYPNGEDREPMALLREMRIIGFTLIGLCAAASAVSLIIFEARCSGTLVYDGTLYYTGVYSGRLWGIYSNPDFPAAIIAAMVSLIQIPVCRAATKNRKTLPWQVAFSVLCLILNYWYAVLAQSRGSLYAFDVFFLIYLFFQFRKKVFAPLRSMALSCLLSAGVAILGTAVLWCGGPVILRLSAGLPELAGAPFASETSSVSSRFSSAPSSSSSAASASASPAVSTSASSASALAPQQSGAKAIGRNTQLEETNVLTHRPYIWKMGLAKFLKKPVFGYGNSGSTKGVILNDLEVRHFHNFVVQSLVADGLAGTLPLMIFLLLALAAMVRYCVRHRSYTFRTLKNSKIPEVPEIIYSLMALIAFYLANNMVEVFIAFSVSLPDFVFWIYLGYLMSLMMRGQPLSHTDRLIRRLGASRPAPVEEKTI